MPKQPVGQYSRRVQRVASIGAYGSLALVLAVKYAVAEKLGYPEYAWLLPVAAIVFSLWLPLGQVLYWLNTGQAQAGAVTFLSAAGTAALGMLDDAALMLSMWTLTAVMRARIYELVMLPLAAWQTLARGDWPTKKSLAKQLRQMQRVSTVSRTDDVGKGALFALEEDTVGEAEAAATLEDSDAEEIVASEKLDREVAQDPGGEQEPAPETITVAPGAIVPRDGIVLSEGALVSTLWDNLPATTKEVGVQVYAGDVNLGPELILEPTSGADENTLGVAVQLGRNGMVPLWRRSPFGRTLRVWSLWWGLTAVLIAAGAPFVFGVTVSQALYKGMAFLALSLPGACVAALELPLVAATGAAFRRRFIPRAGWVIPQMARLGTIVLAWDATFGRVRRFVADVLPVRPKACSPMELLALAAAVENAAGGGDTVATAICSAAQREGLSLPQAKDGRRKVNEGTSAIIDGHKCLVGNARFMHNHGIDTASAAGIVQKLTEQECRPVFCAAGGYLLGAIGITEPHRQAWPNTYAQLRKLAVKLVVVNGNAVDGRNAWAPGHPEGTVSLLMGQEIPAIRSWENKPVNVGVIGDAVKDQDILNQADVGIAIGPVCLENPAGHLAHMHHDLADLPWMIRLGKSVRRRTRWLTMLCFLVRIASLALIVVSHVGAVEIVAIDMLTYAVVAAVSLQLLGKDPIPLPHRLEAARRQRKKKGR